jgi:hypothetical protein
MSGDVAPAGIEPAPSESESEILSIELRSQMPFAGAQSSVATRAAKIAESWRLKNLTPKNAIKTDA